MDDLVERLRLHAAEIETLRERATEMERQRDDYLSREWAATKAHRKAEARAERMAEALRMIANQGPHYGPDGTYKTWQHWVDIARAALDQEAHNG